jgi:hypothetical protein
LLLQLNEPPNAAFAITDIFPALGKALDGRTAWPALLVWNRESDVALFPFEETQHAALESILWVLRHLGRDPLRRVRAEYARAFGAQLRRPTTIIQISDIHIGSEEASVRLPRLQQHIADLIDIHGTDANVLLAVTGDLMDTPDDEHLDRVRSFLQFLTQLQISAPIVLLGNHDVRNRGFLTTQLAAAFELPMGSSPSGIRWFDEL